MADTTTQTIAIPVGPNGSLVQGTLITNKNGDAEWYQGVGLDRAILPTFTSNKSNSYKWQPSPNCGTGVPSLVGSSCPTAEQKQNFYSNTKSVDSLNNARLNTFNSPAGFNSPQLATQLSIPGTVNAAPTDPKQPNPPTPSAPSSSGQAAAPNPTTPITNAEIKQLNVPVNPSTTAANALNSIKGEALRYPRRPDTNGDQDYLKIEIYDYVKSGLGEDDIKSFKLNSMTERLKGTRPIQTIHLPAYNQSGINDSLTVGWGSGELNPLTAQFARVAMQTMNDASNGFGSAFGTFMTELKEVGKNFADASPEIKSMLVNYFTEQAVNTPGLLSRTAGAAINNNVELLFTGVQLRDFTLTYRLTPRFKDEADEIKKIIRAFKVSMTPPLSTEGIFLLAPCVYKLSYISRNEDHPFLNRFKACALKGFNVNYTPDGNYMTYADGRSMTQYELQFSFGEIDPIYRDDYNKDIGKTGMGY